MTLPATDALIRALGLPALFVGPDGRVLASSAEVEPLFGPEVVGRPLAMVSRAPAVLQAVEEVTARRAGATQVRMASRDGPVARSFRVSVAWVDAADLPGVLCLFHDVTELEQTGQMRRDFVANVSHELKTPLTALIGFIETLRGPARNDAAAQARFLDIMDREAQRMNRLVRDLLHLSRVEAEERRRPTRPADLAALARMAVATFRPLAEDTGVVLTSSLPETAEIPGDADQLTQVLHNLIENAIKYGGQGGAVAVVLAEDASLGGPGFRITVTDSGEGIAAHHLPRLTERFYRVDDDRSRAKGGTGLGLAIVKHIVQRHRGRLMIDSRPGEGSSFAVVLPAA